MLALLVCILCSTLISLIFKWFGRFGVQNLPAIAVNYWVCVACGTLYGGANVFDADLLAAPWLPVAFVLGFLFIGGFNLNALCVQRAGIAVTSVVQRMSILLSVSFAVIYYREQLGPAQVLGVVLGLAAVILSVRLPAHLSSSDTGSRKAVWRLPLAVFVVAGAIESLLTVAQKSFAAGADAQFSSTLFLWAGTLGTLVLLLQTLRGELRVTYRDLLGGILLGVPNFFSIQLILVALYGGLDASTVFPVLNVATILLSTLLALLLFRERLSAKQWAGVFTASVAIVLLTAFT